MTMPPRRVSYAQNGEDVRAWRALRGVDEPFYVEVGASDPLDDSLTAALSAEGWHGLLLEPEPEAAERLRQARPRDVVIAAAAHSSPGVLTWNDVGTRGRGSVEESEGVERTISVPAVRLTDVLDDLDPPAVHFLSVDVEGHEEQALRGLDLTRWKPWLVCVEATLPGSRTTSYDGWEPLLLDAGYGFVTFDGLNRWYVSPEHLDLAAAVAEPFGVLDVMLDGWQRRDVVDAGRHARVLEERLAAAQAQAEELTAVRREAEVLRRDVETANRAVQALGREVEALERQVELVKSQRDAAVARERVMLESKSWRLTKPLRRARSTADTALARRALNQPSPPPPPPAHVDTPADLRRRRALQAKLAAAVERRR
ncbi:MAG: FkbM family methyltransferase [Frankiales bacterium]|nr:FkbM family methyltransferase [Frankiales bacterium]